MVKMRALANHPKYAEGTVYEVAPVFAASENYRRVAIFAEADAELTVDVKEEPTDEEPQQGRRRTYKRRDLKAEP